MPFGLAWTRVLAHLRPVTRRLPPALDGREKATFESGFFIDGFCQLPRITLRHAAACHARGSTALHSTLHYTKPATRPVRRPRKAANTVI